MKQTLPSDGEKHEASYGEISVSTKQDNYKRTSTKKNLLQKILQMFTEIRSKKERKRQRKGKGERERREGGRKKVLTIDVKFFLNDLECQK